MIISPKYDFVYFATMKTGSSSISSILSELNDPELKNFEYDKNDPMIDDSYDKKYFKHTTSYELNEKKYENYFKIAFVRNPWDRVLSWFFFYGRCEVRVDLISKNETFNEFILNKSRSYRWGGENQSQYNFTKCCDFIGRYENLQEDFNTICDKIKIPKQQLPHINKTKHKSYTEYYDEETKSIVAEMYSKDIEYFDYEFGN